MWTWKQSSGELFKADGELVARGYSGHDAGVNNPADQALHNVGPIPQGQWNISAPRETTSHGPYVLPLTAKAGTETFGRSGFLIHGDLVTAPGQHQASLGCIILARSEREKIWNSGDHELEVTE